MSLIFLFQLIYRTDIASTFDYPADVSSISYFLELLKLLQISSFREHLLTGFVSSATSGTEDICRAASNAFVTYMQQLDDESRKRTTEKVSSIILDQLNQNALQDDRQVVPLLQFLCFLLDQNLLIEASADIWAIMKKVHSPNSSLSRIEAAMNCYARLLAIGHYQRQAKDKLTRQLLHRWPKVDVFQFPVHIPLLMHIRRSVMMQQICYTLKPATPCWPRSTGMEL